MKSELEVEVEEGAADRNMVDGSCIEVEELEIGDDRGESQGSDKKWQAREMEYKMNRVTRQKIFHEKKKRMLKIAEQMKVMCGASVKIQLQADTGNSYHYNSHGKAQTRHVKIQYGPSFIGPCSTTNAVQQFPSSNTASIPSTPHHSHEPSLPNQPSSSCSIPNQPSTNSILYQVSRTTPTVVDLPGRKDKKKKKKIKKTPPRAKDCSKCGKCR